MIDPWAVQSILGGAIGSVGKEDCRHGGNVEVGVVHDVRMEDEADAAIGPSNVDSLYGKNGLVRPNFLVTVETEPCLPHGDSGLDHSLNDLVEEGYRVCHGQHQRPKLASQRFLVVPHLRYVVVHHLARAFLRLQVLHLLLNLQEQFVLHHVAKGGAVLRILVHHLKDHGMCEDQVHHLRYVREERLHHVEGQHGPSAEHVLQLVEGAAVHGAAVAEELHDALELRRVADGGTDARPSHPLQNGHLQLLHVGGEIDLRTRGLAFKHRCHSTELLRGVRVCMLPDVLEFMLQGAARACLAWGADVGHPRMGVCSKVVLVNAGATGVRAVVGREVDVARPVLLLVRHLTGRPVLAHVRVLLQVRLGCVVAVGGIRAGMAEGVRECRNVVGIVQHVALAHHGARLLGVAKLHAVLGIVVQRAGVGPPILAGR
mmetsp:Transcript_35923/g.64239  ORF Transcript_35923/g.64239 Transcript_35923/m.64239 type:complete len:429 (+) Transcript_35923:3366-4652(+)